MRSTAPRRAAAPRGAPSNERGFAASTDLVRERPGARAAAALLASALANAAVLAALDRAGALVVPGARRAAPVALARIGGAEWEAARRIAGPPAPASPPRPLDAGIVPPVRPEPPRGMIVSVAPSQDPRRPERARFLAERDNTVARETQWRGPVDPSKPLAPRPTAGAEGGQGIPVPGEEGKADESAPGREGAAAAETRIARARLALSGLGGGSAARRAPGDVAAAARTGEGGARRAGRFDPRVLPAGDAFEAAGAGSPSADRLPGVADGDATLVNTRAFRFAAFYRRVYEAIRGEWRPNEEWDARDPHDRVFGRGPRRVLVDLVLEADGRLRDARLVRGSGLDFFDREALRAVAAAAPFPNPPRALVGPDGLVVVPVPLLFEWGQGALLDRLRPGR
jgi:TonB family protein